ncbi:MAG: hypothetical protein LBG44_08305 [Gemmatimonadota bacterium]|jgi:hypothetical protein|nr:hypothetical protein [Gemmatimonadota bacterium]
MPRNLQRQVDYLRAALHGVRWLFIVLLTAAIAGGTGVALGYLLSG